MEEKRLDNFLKVVKSGVEYYIYQKKKQFVMPIKSIIGLLALVSLLISCNQKEKVETNINRYTNVVLVQSEFD